MKNIAKALEENIECLKLQNATLKKYISVENDKDNVK